MAEKKSVQDQRQEALARALMQIEKQFGAGSIMRLGEGPHLNIECIPSGSLSLDIALGGRGFPRGRIVEIFGPESSGKTSLTLHVVANAQKAGGIAAFIDTEHALDPTYARKLGVDIESLLVSQPDTGEQALDIAETLIRSNAVDLVVVDSVAALVPKAELEGEMGESHMGLQARLMSQALRKLAGAIHRSHTCMMFTNQIREKIGIVFGNPEVTPGGRALKFYCSVRVEIRKLASLKDGDLVIGNRTRAKVVKNKIAPPFRAAEFDIIYNEGISINGEIVDLGVKYNIISKTGAWLNYGQTRLGQGRDNAKAFFRENPAICEEIRLKVMEKAEGAGWVL